MENYQDQGEYYEEQYEGGDYSKDYTGESFEGTEEHGEDHGVPEEQQPTYTEFYDRLQGQGLGPKLAGKIDELHQQQIMSPEELDDRALDALREFSEEDALVVVDQFAKSDLSHVQNKSAFLCGVMKTYRAKMKIKETKAETKTGGGPDEDKIKALLDRTGYTLDITTGQRKYGGPPPSWEGPPPGQGEKRFCAQIFVGKIPRDMFEDELVPIFEEFGPIYDFRLMIDPMSGQNKGYAFCTFTTKEAAQSAVKKMDKHEIKPGRKLGVCLSLPNDRLFVGSIPKSKTKKQIFDEFAAVTEGLVDVIVYISPEDKNKNRGFAFLQYDTHKAASLARRRLMSGRIKVFGHITPTVDWADPQEEPDDEIMSTVKVVYVRNLSPAIDEAKLSELFKQYGEVEKVKKLKDYAFIHFTDRENAVRAIEELNGQDLDDLKIEVSLARPQTEKKDSRRRGQSGFGALNDPVSRPGQRGFRGGPRGGPSFRGAPRGGPRGGGRPAVEDRYYEGGYGNQGGYGGGGGGGGGDYRGGYEEDYGYGGGYDQGYDDSYNSGGGGGGGGGASGGYGEDNYYDDYYGYNDQSYDNYYSQEPPRQTVRGGGRGGPSSRGTPRGSFRGGRGGPGGRGGRDDSVRGGGRGGPRGGMGGRGGSARGGVSGRGGPRGGSSSLGGPPKRKMENGQGTPQPKRKYGVDQGGAWNPQPIAQQPLQPSYDEYGGGQEWYSDTYGSQWK